MGNFSNTHGVVAAAPEKLGETLGTIELILFQGTPATRHGTIACPLAQAGAATGEQGVARRPAGGHLNVVVVKDECGLSQLVDVGCLDRIDTITPELRPEVIDADQQDVITVVYLGSILLLGIE